MLSNFQAYDALPSETASTSRTSCQPESQLSREKAEQSTWPPSSSRPMWTCISWFWTSWKWELATCLLVLATPIIIFGTLYPHSGQPLPQWPFRISINSLISVYALVFKAAIGFILTSCIGQLQWNWFSRTRPLADMLHFDNATRGADGAMGLIWRQRCRQPLTALGCMIMVLVVAVDPFIQQLIQPVNCSVDVSGDHAAATLPRANVFVGGGYIGKTLKVPDFDIPDKDIESAFYDAIFSPGQDPPWQCSTGNCTFPTYGTLGFCSSCQDASADVTITATCSDPDSSYASHHPMSGADCPANSSFALESNFTAGEYIKLGTKMTISNHGFADTIVLADADSEKEPLPDGVRNLLFGFLIGATANTGGRIDWTTSDNSTCNSRESEGIWSCQGYGAATCSLQPCIQIYNASISGGVLQEHLVESSSDTAWGMIHDKDGWPLYLALIDTQCSADVQTPSTRYSSAGSRWLPYDFNLPIPFPSNFNTDAIPLPDDAMSLLKSGCLYLISADAVFLTTEYYLSGAIQPLGTGTSSGGHAADTEVFEMMTFEGPEMIRGIYNRGHTSLEHVQSVVSNISDSLTTYIRKHGGSPQLSGSTDFSRDVHGKVYHYATCLQVDWPWLSFPASLAGFTTLFFLMVVGVTKARGTSFWKASPLAWILRAEGLGNGNFWSSTRTCEGMKERSEQIAVHLLEEDMDGPRILMADIKEPNLH